MRESGFLRAWLYFFIYFFGYLKDASKAPRKGLTFLCCYILNLQISECRIFPAKEKLCESAVGCAASDGRGRLVSAAG